VSAACDINAQSNSGRTALWKAAQSGRREIVHLLYALGAALDRRSQVRRQISSRLSLKFEITSQLVC